MYRRFPFNIFLLHALYYAGYSIYGTYLNLYLDSLGFTKTMIGTIVSVSTVFVLGSQLFWGYASDKAGNSNTIIKMLLAGSAVFVLLFYASSGYPYLLCMITLFSMFFMPMTPLNDNLTLQLLEGSKWDFGQVRIGGTLGYALTVLVVGLVIGDNYSWIFWMLSLMMVLGFALTFGFPNTSSKKEKREKTPLREIFRNKLLVALILFNLAHCFGAAIYYTYYPIYFISIGGNSSLVGTMMFIGALTEIPLFAAANRLVRRFGIKNMIIGAGLAAALRWIILYSSRNMTFIVITGFLHGLMFVALRYSMVTLVNEAVPADLRATSQSVIAFLEIFFLNVVYGYLGGVTSDYFGVNNMMLVSCIIIIITVGIFAFWSKNESTFIKNNTMNEKNGRMGI